MKNRILYIGWIPLVCLFFTLNCKPNRPEPLPLKPLVRKNLATLDSTSLASLIKGMKVMMQRDSTDPRSWAYQAKIHGVPEGYKGDWKAGWAQCTHKNFFFLPWHRMYVYYFERILREASGDPTLTLPYWDYEDVNNRELPVIFQNFPDTSLVFPAIKRAKGLNSGECCLKNKVVKTDLALSQTYFYSDDTISGDNFPVRRTLSRSFGGIKVPSPDSIGKYFGVVENGPHNLMHLVLGGFYYTQKGGIEGCGQMADVNRAALDPVFWTHHSNIDRMWNLWIAQGHKNPIEDDAWMNHRFLFFDEKGDSVRISAKEVLNTKEQLNYVYDTELDPSFSPKIDVVEASGDNRIFSERIIGEIREAERIEKGLQFLNIPLNPGFKAPKEDDTSTFILLLDSITVEGACPPPGVFSVYVGLPEKINSDSLLLGGYSGNYAGSLAFFGTQHVHHGHKPVASFMAHSIDLTDFVRQKERIFSIRNLPILISRDSGLKPCNRLGVPDSACYTYVKEMQELLAEAPGFSFKKIQFLQLN